ncbi:MAG TPA: hypothetical protein VEH07_03380, partial [Alphaproteobacteria bacterium]|nr:hypothetical protein [Alphaproteobacteria bacterium]
MIALVVSLAIGAICQTSAVESPKQKSKLYDVTEWNNGVGDINGEVGHRLYVEGPRATCVNQNGEFLSSDAHRGIVSGILPPGLSFEPNDNAIAGIPTDRGHWIVRLI